MLSSSKVHVTKTVNELLFAGYDDSLIRLGRLAAVADDIPPFDKFGWFYMVRSETTWSEITTGSTCRARSEPGSAETR